MPLNLNKFSAAESSTLIDQLVPNKTAAKILNLSESTLNNDRWMAKKSGTSPKVPYVRLPTGGIRYCLSVLQELIDTNTVA